MKYISLNTNDRVTVDDQQYDGLSKVKWFYNKGYAVRQLMVDGKLKNIKMHRLIMNATAEQLIDHINGDKLDNRLANLRFCTKAENGYNRGRNKNNRSGYKGVSRNGKKWMAQITSEGVVRHLGSFETPELAHQAYAQAANSYHKEFAHAQ